jgi:uncharacterized DUF497 family protein
MVITFDPVKRAKNLHSRQLDFFGAEIVLSGPVLVDDTRIDYGEQRFQLVGFLAGRMVMVISARRSRVMSTRNKRAILEGC